MRGVHIGKIIFIRVNHQVMVNTCSDSSPAAAIERAVYICQQNKCEHLLSGRMQIVKYAHP